MVWGTGMMNVAVGQQVRLPNGMRVSGLTQADTLSVYRDIFEDACYLRHGIRLKDGDTILDVGANTGLFALWLNSFLSRARLYCFEPIPAIYATLVENLNTYDRLGAEAVNTGVSDHDGLARFVYYPLFSNASTLFPDHSERIAHLGREWVIEQAPTLPAPLPYLVTWVPRWMKQAIAELIRRYHLLGRRVRCRLQTLSGFIRERGIEQVDLLKIDAERSEGRILDGLADADWPRIRQVVMEVHDGKETTQHFLRLLRARGLRAEAGLNPAMPDLSLVYAVRP